MRAQTTNGSISGRVTDPSHAVIAGAKVAAVKTGTNFRYETVDSALVSADQALAEGRSSIQELRSEPLKETSMEQVLLAMGRQLASSQNGEHDSPALRVIVEGTRRAKPAMIREEIYRIARELLRNAYRHAHARSIEAELRYDDDAFALIVRDDGKGID